MLRLIRLTGFSFVFGTMAGVGATLLACTILTDRLSAAILEALWLPATGSFLPHFRLGCLLLIVGIIGGVLVSATKPVAGEEGLNRPQWGRLRIRTLMAAIVVVALALGLDTWLRRRAAQFKVVSIGHAREFWRMQDLSSFQSLTTGTAEEVSVRHRAIWHDNLATKYNRAAARPWEPLPADPPEPSG